MTETGLQRKPRVGEVLRYHDGALFTVERFDSVHTELCHIKPVAGGKSTLFIWTFRDGLNKLFSHTVETAPAKCPKCGTAKNVRVDATRCGDFTVVCDGCYDGQPCANGATREAAIIDWNERADDARSDEGWI